MPSAGIGQQKGLNSPQQPPTAHRTTNTSKVEQIGLQSFASSARMGFQVTTVVKSPPVNGGDARDVNLIPESGRTPGVGNSNLL